MLINVLIADQCQNVYDQIKSVIGAMPEILHLEWAKDSAEACAIYTEQHPEIVFLDVSIAYDGGNQLAQMLSASSIPIFMTEYENESISSLKHHEMDYIVKPLKVKTLQNVFYKALMQLSASSETIANLNSFIDTLKGESHYLDKCVIKEPGSIKLVSVERIRYITGSGNYVKLHLEDQSHILFRETINALERLLDPKQFVRIHRSTIVRIQAIEEFRLMDTGLYHVILDEGEELALSKSHRGTLEQLTMNDVPK